jgi:hypothetical protein
LKTLKEFINISIETLQVGFPFANLILKVSIYAGLYLSEGVRENMFVKELQEYVFIP